MSRRVAAFRPVVEGLEDRIVPYALTGYQWGSTTVTASFMPDGSTTNTGATTNLFSTLDASFSTETWQRELARALQTWANATRLNFYFVSDGGATSGTSGSHGDIRLTMSPRSDAYAGYTYYPSGSSLGGDMFLSSNYTWQIGQHLDLYSVVLHELGHALGLGHSTDGTVMAPMIGSVYSGLSSDDIAGIQAIYGTRQNDSYDSGSGNNSFGTATSVGLNGSGAVSFNADLTSMDDVDYYKLTAPANASGSLTVSVDATDISLLTPKVLVYDANFNLVGSASATTYEGKATLSLTGLTAGATYYVVADGATSDVFGMGAYKLSAQFGQAAASQPSVSVGNVSLTEGDSGTKQFNFTVSLSASSSSTVTVQYATANGSASSGSDYTATSGTLTFAPGETQKTVTVDILGDVDGEANETFTVTLSSPTNAALGTSEGTGTILNDDLTADRFEVNNTASKAKNFGRTDSISQSNLNLHTTADKDFYLFTTSQSGTYTFTVTRTQGAGTLDVAILNGTQKLIASGYSGSGSVTLTLTFVAGKKYYIRTASSTGGTIGYTLGVARSGGGGAEPGHGTLPSGIPLVGEYDPDHDHDHEETESAKGHRREKVKHENTRHAAEKPSKLFLAPEADERYTQKLSITDSASDAPFGFPII